MRVLYKVSRQWKFKYEDDSEYRNFHRGSALYYGEMPEDKVSIFEDFSDAIECYENFSVYPRVKRTLLSGRTYLAFDPMEDFKMTKLRFRPFNVRRHYERVRDDNYTVDMLIKELNIVEFIQFCKDKCLDPKIAAGGAE